MRRVCVYLGSAEGRLPAYARAARALGAGLAEAGITLVYGGGRVGLMGELADAALAKGGEVIGVIPEKLYRSETAHPGLHELLVVEGMHARKAIMTHLSDAFVALPGGFGTLEELFEMGAWKQLGLHDKPIYLLNVEGYFDSMLAFLHHATEQGLCRAGQGELLQVASSVESLLLTLTASGARPGIGHAPGLA